MPPEYPTDRFSAVPKIAVLDDYQNVARSFRGWSAVKKRAEVTVFHDHLDHEDDLVNRLLPFDAICLMRERTALPARVLERLPNLKLVTATGMRNTVIDLENARARGIGTCGTDSRQGGPAELTWAFILSAARQLSQETHSLRAGGWQTGVGADLEGSTLAIMGLGRIGRRVASVGHAFGMRVIAWSPNLTARIAGEVGVELVDKATLMREADWLTLHLKHSSRSTGIVGPDDLKLMKPSAWLINTSRGSLVDEEALLAALFDNRIAGAALDVFDAEPLPGDHPFRKLDNVIATPHIGYVTKGTYELYLQQTAENLVAWLDGRLIRPLAQP